MNILTTIARILLGAVFTLSGASVFFLLGHPPTPPPGIAGVFMGAFFESRWVLFVDLVELIAGVMLLADRFVPLALVLVAALLCNILVFHATMMPGGLPVPIVLTIFWYLVARRYRASLEPLLVAKAPTQSV